MLISEGGVFSKRSKVITENEINNEIELHANKAFADKGGEIYFSHVL